MRSPHVMCAGALLVLASITGCGGTPVAQQPTPISTPLPTTAAKRSPAEAYQRKIDEHLLEAIQNANGDTASASPLLSTVPLNADGTVDISVRAPVTEALVQQIEATGALVTYTRVELNTINARAPLRAIEPIAQLPPVVFVVPAPQGTMRVDQPSPSAPASP